MQAVLTFLYGYGRPFVQTSSKVSSSSARECRFDHDREYQGDGVLDSKFCEEA